MRTTNSSPPRRATVAALRTPADKRAAAVTSSRSPASWPRVSFTGLKLSRLRLSREQAATARRLTPHESAAGRLVRAARQASTAIAEARSELAAVERELSTFSDPTVQQTRQLGVTFQLPDVHGSADERYVTTWYRKKTGHDLDPRHTSSCGAGFPTASPTIWTPCARSPCPPPRDTTPQACYAWAIPPWLRHPDTRDDAPQLRRQLGATTSGAPRLPDHPYPGPALLPGALLSVPWRHALVLTQPVDAVELAYWYRRSAWSQHWHPEAAPVPFWLPTEHAVTYP